MSDEDLIGRDSREFGASDKGMLDRMNFYGKDAKKIKKQLGLEKYSSEEDIYRRNDQLMKSSGKNDLAGSSIEKPKKSAPTGDYYSDGKPSKAMFDLSKQSSYDMVMDFDQGKLVGKNKPNSAEILAAKRAVDAWYDKTSHIGDATLGEMKEEARRVGSMGQLMQQSIQASNKSDRAWEEKVNTPKTTYYRDANGKAYNKKTQHNAGGKIYAGTTAAHSYNNGERNTFDTYENRYGVAPGGGSTIDVGDYRSIQNTKGDINIYNKKNKEQ